MNRTRGRTHLRLKGLKFEPIFYYCQVQHEKHFQERRLLKKFTLNYVSFKMLKNQVSEV